MVTQKSQYYRILRRQQVVFTVTMRANLLRGSGEGTDQFPNDGAHFRILLVQMAGQPTHQNHHRLAHCVVAPVRWRRVEKVLKHGQQAAHGRLAVQVNGDHGGIEHVLAHRLTPIPQALGYEEGGRLDDHALGVVGRDTRQRQSNTTARLPVVNGGLDYSPQAVDNGRCGDKLLLIRGQKLGQYTASESAVLF